MRRILPLFILVTGALSLSTAAFGQSAQPAQAPARPPSAPAVAAPAMPPGQARATTPPPPSAPTPAVAAQTPQAAPAPSPSAMAYSSWQNVKLEFTITDTFGTTPTKKTVSMLVVDRGTGRIRSSTQVATTNAGYQSLSINIDATVTLRSRTEVDMANARGESGWASRILLNLTAQYTPDANVQTLGAGSKPASLDESLNIVVQDGKPTLVSQSADPQGDRKVTLEVTATIVK